MFVMIVDDSRSSLDHLQRLVEETASVRTRIFSNPEDALDAAARQKFDVIMVDYIMPSMDGIDFIRRMRLMHNYAQVPIVMLTATESEEVRQEALEAGATDFLAKCSSSLELRVKLRNLIRMSDAVRKLDDQAAWLAGEVEAATKALLAREEEMIFRLSLAVEYRDDGTGEHIVRVAQYAKMIAEELGMNPDQCRAIYVASPLHDVGKVAISDNILLKPGRLNEQEMEQIRTHPTVGEHILGGSSSDLFRLAAEIAGNHHERWDGKGYPRGLKGSAIPLCARIVAVADVFDALTSARPYKEALSVEAALSYLKEQRGLHFDPACLDAFLTGIAKSGLGSNDEPRHPELVSA